MPKKSDMHDKMGMDPHDAKNFDSSSTYGKGGPGDADMKKGDEKKEVPAPPPCYTVQVSATYPVTPAHPCNLMECPSPATSHLQRDVGDGWVGKNLPGECTIQPTDQSCLASRG